MTPHLRYRQGPHRRRKASSLIEMIVLIFVLSIAFGLVGTSLSSLSRVDDRFEGFAEERNDLDRLMQRLRSDIHAAQAATLDGAMLDSATLNLTMPDDHAVIYIVTTGQARRTEDGVTNRFRLPTHGSWSVSEETLGTSRLLKITFHSTDKPAGEEAVLFGSLVAEVNRAARWSLSGGEP